MIKLNKKTETKTLVKDLQPGDYFTVVDGNDALKQVVKLAGDKDLLYIYVNSDNTELNYIDGYFHSYEAVKLFKPTALEFDEI